MLTKFIWCLAVVWDTLKGAIEADHETTKIMLEAAELIVTTDDMTEIYDQTGTVAMISLANLSTITVRQQLADDSEQANLNARFKKQLYVPLPDPLPTVAHGLHLQLILPLPVILCAIPSLIPAFCNRPCPLRPACFMVILLLPYCRQPL